MVDWVGMLVTELEKMEKKEMLLLPVEKTKHPYSAHDTL